MRPTEAGFGRPRPSAAEDELDDTYTPLGMSSYHAVSGSQLMSFCVADEAAVNASLEQSLSAFTRPPPPPRDLRKKDRHHTLATTSAPPRSEPASSDLGGTSHPDPALASSSSLSSPCTSFSSTTHASTAKETIATKSSPPMPSTAQPLHELPSRPESPLHHHVPPQSSSNHGNRGAGTPMSAAHHHGAADLSLPMTPVLFGISGPASAFSGISSRRNSLTSESLSEVEGDLATALAIGPGATGSSRRHRADDDDVEADRFDGSGFLEANPRMGESGSAPQLVMPSIKMPSRRPFSEEGKNIGRLKLLVAGESGTGKTSLIKAIVQACPHIVHVDPITPAPISQSLDRRRSVVITPDTHGKVRPRPSQSLSKTADSATRHITEVFASTKPLPVWWSDLDGDDCGSQMKRRKSISDNVLDRNICFVDTPGFGSGSPQSLQGVMPVVQYIESHLERISSNALSDADLLNLLGGEGGSQVDAVLYLISNDLKPADLQYLRWLAPLTNVVPLLAQADTMSAEQVSSKKQKILAQLLDASIRPFGFSNSLSSTGGLSSIALTASGTLTTVPSPPFAVSSAMGFDSEIMDASLLMSPEYVQPLMPSELGALVTQVLSADGASFLRHSAARKYLQWRSGERGHNKPQALYRPLSAWPPPNAYHPQPDPPSALALATFSNGGRAMTNPGAGSGDVHSEQHLAQVRLANWASELQRSLANERARYEALARGDRAIWLTERLGECVQDGTLVPINPAGGDKGRSHPPSDGRRSSSGSGSGSSSGPRDRPHVAVGHLAVTVAASVGNQTAAGRRVTASRQQPRDGRSCNKPHTRALASAAPSQVLSQDPLGLLEVAADLRAKSWVALEVLGSIGLLGGLALWITGRYWHTVDGITHPYDWIVERWYGGD